MNANNNAAMAANMPQMGGAGPVRGRPQHQQLSQLIYSQIMTHQLPPAPWHGSVSPNMRVGHAMNIITNAFLAMPQVESTQVVTGGLQYERDAFAKCPDKASYEAAVSERVNELFKKRQANEQNIHNTLNAQAAANQSQMMMNQNMQMRGMGQPLQQGFQNLQQQMQPGRMNQQGQPGLGMTNANGLPMNPNQQVMQMGTQMRPQMAMQSGMASLAPQDRIKVNQVAIAKFNSIAEPTRSQYRAAIQQKFGPHAVAQLQQENIDPLVYYFQSQIIQNVTKNQAGVNQAGMQQMQAHQQRSMNQQPPQQQQQLPAGSNGEFGAIANVESIMNQQKAGMMAQEAGQMVVPASNGAGRNATPQPIGSMLGPNQGAGQPALPHQLPQQFNHQPAQQLKMDQRAAQTQAQIRAQAQAKQMQGQPGGLNGPGAASQSPAMNTLNAPVRRTPIGVGQAEGHPQMGQGNVPFGQMDPRFNQAGQRTPMGPNANMNRSQVLHSILAQMPPETRAQVMSQPQEKAAEMILRWNASRQGAPMAGRPQPQMGQLGPGNPMAQSMGHFAPGGNSLGQHPNMGMPMNQQNQFMMQQQMNKLRNPNAPQGTLDRNALMDNMAVPPKIMESLRQSQGAVSPDVKKWGQLKQFMAQKNMNQQQVNGILSIQTAQFQSYLKSNPALAAANLQLPQSAMPQQGMPPNGQAPPQMGQPTPNIAGSNPNITVSSQEMQSARNHERFKGLPDEKLRQVLFSMKMQALKNRASQMSGPQAQAPQVPQPGHMATAPSPSQPTQGAVAPQRQQNAGPEASTASPAVQGRNMKQPQNNRAAPTAPAAPMAKTGTKRPHPDDAPEVPNSSGTPVQRPAPQQPQPGASSSVPPQMPQPSPEQLAAMTPEQRQKYETMVKNRQAGGPMSEEMVRLRTIGQERYQAELKEQLPDIPMTPEQHRDMLHKIQALGVEMTKMSKLLTRWYSFTRDDMRAGLFFKLRTRLFRQYADTDKMSMPKEKFSITQADLDSIRIMLESMGKDLTAHFSHGMRKNPSQQNATEPAPQGASARPSAPTSQPAPLNAANLEKQTQALNRMHQRNNSRAGQPPPPPTTAQPPFSFGAQSPDGRPTYAGGPAVTQDNLQLPARKKPKTEAKAGAGPNQTGSSANASPQGQKLSSPEMNKRQAASEARPAKSQFRCTDPYCDFRSIGFPTAEALQKHTQEEHVKPAEDPMRFAVDGLAEVLGLHTNGKPKHVAPISGNVSSPGDVSKRAQTPPIKADLANSRELSMKRQGSMTGSKPNELIKTIAGKAGTPKPDPNSKAVDGTAFITTANGGAVSQAALGEFMGATIDPQDLLSAVTGLETGGNGAILDMNVYRSLTPNDTPESSKDSATSELNSDVSEGVALNVTLDMGFGTWDPFALGHEPPIVDLENYGPMPTVPYPDFSWDEVQPDFDKPFALDTSFFSLETS
ncbi:hypothetical protein FHL15_007752 [Xylaria flabelliformis]|uniref:Mediator complex subunit 15 KIX domain-containing protein n=1 Tax=Xylaria flabelliformis TaxID=2512241 RepID=A0A553HTP9_9PEZI|nr:hypothetical protein FHL15_007752 [Xylaria flabelliformis]